MRYIYYFIVFSFFSYFQTASSQNSVFQPAFSTYWQQHVDYNMDIDMDVENYRYKGSQKLIYTNNSPDVLQKVYYHLFFNAFQPGSEMDLRLQTIVDPDDRMVVEKKENKRTTYLSKISTLKPEDYGYIKVLSLLQNGKEVGYEVEGTILEVTLNEPIKSGEQAIFDMKFEGQVPYMIRRSGKNNENGVALSMAQWYPKMAEYDAEGWHTDPYIMREFYGVWGDFDVTIHIDKKYILGGTGYIQNPQEVGHGYENPDLPIKLKEGNKLSWHFKAPNVHDFSWAADPDYVHDKLQVKEGVVMHFLYKNDTVIQKNWRLMQPNALKIMEYYNQNIGQYPYNQYSIIQAGDGGMEYGMCTFVHKGYNVKGLTGLVAHEMAHAWFQFALATNESKHAWMDEGFSSFIETLALEEIFPTQKDFLFEETYGGYYYMVSTTDEEPLTTHSDRYHTNMSYSINAYYKGSVFLAQLSYIIGWENLKSTLKEYYAQWSGRHPKPEDFIRIAEKVSRIHLDWYLNEFVQTTHTIDYAIQSVNENEIVLERLGKMPMPIDLKVVYEDGSTEDVYIPLSLMRGEKPTNAKKLKDWSWAIPTYKISLSKKVTEVKIDSSQLMADINQANNVWKK